MLSSLCAQFAASASVSPTAATTLASRRTRTRENRRSASAPGGAKSPERTAPALASSSSPPEQASSQLARLSSVEEHPSSESLRGAETPALEEDAQKEGADAVVSRSPPSPSTPRRTDTPPTTKDDSRLHRSAHTLEVELPDLSTSFSRSELDLVQLVVDSSLSPEDAGTSPPRLSVEEETTTSLPSEEGSDDNHSSGIRAVREGNDQ